MSNKEIDVFIQNLKDKTTVLQQLVVCIEECKKMIGYTDQVKQMCEDLDIDSANSKLNELDTSLGNLIETVESLNTTINGENGLVSKINTIDDTINGENGLVNQINSIDDAINGEDGISEKIGELEEDLDDLAETVANKKFYRYQLALSFEDGDSHSYYIQLNLISSDIGDINEGISYNDLIGIIYLGQPCYESVIGDPCLIYGISSSNIEFQLYDGTSLLADATPENLTCTILSKQEL